MNEPDITCVIPTFNDRANLPRAVASALNQAGVNVEVILVDDVSDAPTREFISELASTDARISTFFLPCNGGQGRARNIGAALARGRLIAFMDQDDEHAQGWYRYAVEQLKANPGWGALSGHASVIDIPARLGIDENDLRIRGLSLVFITNMVFRKSVFLASGGFPTTEIWRSRIAGEDGAYRQGLAQSWRAMQCTQPALIHRAKEGGATVYFLDRSMVRNNQVVMTQLDEIVRDGRLHAAQREYWSKARDAALEVQSCLNLSGK